MFSFVIAFFTGAMPVSGGAQYLAPPGPGAFEIAPDAPYMNPRLPLGRLGYARRPRCYMTLAPPPGHNGGQQDALYVQERPILVQGPPVQVAPLQIYLVPPKVLVLPSEVTVKPP